MSHEATTVQPAQGVADYSRFSVVGAGMLIVGLALSALAFSQSAAGFGQSYLFAFVFWMVLTLGCFGLTLLHHTVRAQWSLPLLRMWEAGGGPTMLIVMGVAFVPIALVFRESLYHMWVNPPADDFLVQSKAWWLNEPRWLISAAIYFVFWIGVAWVLRRSSLREDQTRDGNEAIRRTNIAAPMIFLFLISVTLCWTDWVMSTEAHWFSTLYGAQYMVYQGLTGLAFGTVVFMLMSRRSPYNELVNKKITRDLGNMLFAFTMLWGYLTLSAYLIIFAANLPEETQYYYYRTEYGWNILGILVVVGQFFVPFLLLLAPRIKAATNTLLFAAAWILFIRFFDTYWLVIPGLHSGEDGRHGFGFQVGDLGAWLLLGGLWLLVFVSQLKQGNLLPVHDPRIEEVVPQHA